MKWIFLIGAAALGLDFYFRDDVLAAVWGLIFLFAAATLWRDNDVV